MERADNGCSSEAAKMREKNRTTNRIVSTSIKLGSVTLLAITGCAHSPKVDMALFDLNQSGDVPDTPKLISGSAPGAGAIKFSPTGTYILISDAQALAAVPQKAGDKSASTTTENVVKVMSGKASVKINSADELATMAFTVTPGSSTQYQIAMTPNETFYFKPNISATFFPGSSRLTELGADSQDFSASDVTTTIGIITSVIGLAGVSQNPEQEPDLMLPYVLDITPSALDQCIYKSAPGMLGKAEQNPDFNKWCQFDTKLTNWKYRLEIVSRRSGSPLFSETDSTAYFVGSNGRSGTTEFPFSPCLQVFLHVAHLGDQQKDIPIVPAITIADSSRVETYLIPSKGTISLGNSCGADLKSQTSTSTTNLDILKSLVDGIAQIKSKQAPASTAKATAK